jgi:hypothetical protein
VEEQLDNSRTEILWELLANPAGKDGLHAYNLQQLVKDYPQSGLLHALLLYAGDEGNLQHAAAYFNPKALYKIANTPDSLGVVDAAQIIAQFTDKPANGHFHIQEEEAYTPVIEEPQQEAGEEIAPPMHDNNWNIEPPAQQEITPPIHNNNWDAEPVAPETSNHFDEPELVIETQKEEIPLNLVTPYVEEMPVNFTIPDEIEEPVSYVEDEENYFNFGEAEVEINEPQPTAERGPEPVADVLPDEYSYTAVEPILPSEINEKQHINEETFDEIVGIEDISLAREYKPANLDIPGITSNSPWFNARKVDLNDEAEKLILNNIAATDFFVFDRAFSDRKNAAPEPAAEIAPEEVIAKYDDEKMPYSFLWWLDKTRKEHAGINQPFVEFKLDTTQSISKSTPDELQQQYYENIFHNTPVVEELAKSEPGEPIKFDPKKKEDEIIERFIHEVPQIKPPSNDKLDNENKAKKSSEDDDELVTETLAVVYADQMLYPKAIATYKKLILKFPEKSRYFAGQIEQLQKKSS